MRAHFEINRRPIGPGHASYIIAEMSANHGGSFESAAQVIRAAKDAGADAIKLQTYTPDTLTINCDNEYFRVGSGTLWAGRNLYELYGEAYTPWEWQPRLKQLADDLAIDLFSTPFDDSAVDFLESMAVPAHKIASFEVVDTALLKKIAATGKPIIMSTGMATLSEIDEAVSTLEQAGATQLVLLKCTSAYPAEPKDMNLRTIPHLSAAFGVPAGLSDHTLGIAVPVAAVALGACVIEKHFTVSRSLGGPDSAFSLEPHEFKAMVDSVRVAERSLGQVHYGLSAGDTKSRSFRRSLFVVEDVEEGAPFSTANVRSIRPGYGLPPKHLPEVLGRRATRAVRRGTPLGWDLIS